MQTVRLHHYFIITANYYPMPSKCPCGTPSHTVSLHCVADLAGNALRRETAPKTEHCTTAFHLRGTDQMPVMHD